MMAVIIGSIGFGAFVTLFNDYFIFLLFCVSSGLLWGIALGKIENAANKKDTS